MRTRAERRHHLDRMKHRVAGYYGGYAKGDAALIGKLARCRKSCSCPGCSPRDDNDWELRRSTLRFLQDVKEAREIL